MDNFNFKIMASGELHDDVKRYLEAKELLSALDKKVTKYRERIMDHLKMLKVRKLEDKAFSITVREMRSEHVYRKDVPPEIWSRFAKPSTAEQLVVVDRTKPRPARSRSPRAGSSRN